MKEQAENNFLFISGKKKQNRGGCLNKDMDGVAV